MDDRKVIIQKSYILLAHWLTGYRIPLALPEPLAMLEPLALLEVIPITEMPTLLGFYIKMAVTTGIMCFYCNLYFLKN